MSHLNQEELVEHYYSRDAAEGWSAAAKKHLEDCAACARAFASLESDLADIAVLEPPARDASYGEQVWQSISPSLHAYPRRKPGWLRLWPGLAYAAMGVLLIAGAFFAGRISVQKPKQNAVAPPKSPVPTQHVVVVVLSDHLDRSERFLVELKHADVDNSELAKPLSEEARSLLAANHICRKKAEEAKDPELNTALDHLDQLLNKLANQPGGLSPAALTELQKEMNSENLLFEVRVLRSRVPGGVPGQGAHSGSKGGTV